MIKWNAAEYNQNSSQLEKWAEELVLKLSLTGNESVLDIGSGDGKVTAAIARLLPNGSVTGIDLSDEMIAFSSHRFSKAEYPNLEFKLMDMRKIALEQQFDIVFSTAALHWITDHLSVLHQIKKCLRTPGKMFLQMGGAGNQEELIQVLHAVKKESKWAAYFNRFEFQYGYYSIAEYRNWLQETGFLARRIELIPKDNMLEGKLGLCQWIKLAFSPYVQRIPEKSQASFIDEIAAAYIRKFPLAANGLCRIKMIRLEVEADLC
jgi:Trans-aconitate methyltransferase